MTGRAANAAAGADHAFDEVLRKSSGLQKRQCGAAFLSACCLSELDIRGILAPLLHNLNNSCCYAAAGCKALAVDRGLLIVLLYRNNLYVSGTKQCTDFPVGYHIICVIRYTLVLCLALLGNAGSDENSDAAGVLCLEHTGDCAHRRNRARHVVLELLREVLAHHVDESRAAGGGHLLAFLHRLAPLCSLIRRSHISAKANLDHIGKADLLQCITDSSHADILTELSLGCRSAHCVYFFAVLDVLNDLRQISLGSDCAERAAVDAVAAADALGLIDFTVAILIEGNGSDRTGLLAGTNQMHNCAIRTGLCAHTALLALVGINVRTEFTDGNCTKLTGIQTGLSKTETAVVCHCISRKRAVVAGRLDNLNHIRRIRISHRVLCAGKTDSLSCNFTFLIDAAAIGRSRTGNQLVNKLFLVLCVKIAIPCKACNLLHDLMFVTH